MKKTTQSSHWHPAMIKIADSQNFPFFQLGNADGFASGLSFKNLNFVPDIISHATPFEIFRQVIFTIAILMVDLWFVRWRLSNESKCNNAMSFKCNVFSVFAKPVKVIAICIRRWFKNATYECIMLWFDSLYTGKVGNLIDSFKAMNVAPFFHALIISNLLIEGYSLNR